MNIELFAVRCVHENDIDVKHRICTIAKEHSRNTSSMKSTATLDVNIATSFLIEMNLNTRFEWLNNIESKQRKDWSTIRRRTRFTHMNLKKWLNTIWNVWKNLQKKNIRLNICRNTFKDIYINNHIEKWYQSFFVESSSSSSSLISSRIWWSESLTFHLHWFVCCSESLLLLIYS